MNLKRTLIAVTLGAMAAGGAVTAASAQTYVPAHPRQAEVLDRAAAQRAAIRHEERTGRISPAKAHRLLVANKRVAMKEHRMARRNGGYITVKQQHRLNRQENQLARRVPG
jgi:hypothetical protein